MENEGKRMDGIKRHCIKGIVVLAGILLVPLLMPANSFAARTSPLIIEHNCTDITNIPESAINQAKADLHIAYGHTSHGSQLTDGMTGLVDFANSGGLGLSLPEDIFEWNDGGTGGALDFHDYAMGGDCGYYPQWVNNTRAYLGEPDPDTGRGTAHPDVNVIIWSWCGQASHRTEQEMIDTYLDPMTELEEDYPNVIFVYMTGHADGTGLEGNLHARNQQVKAYCEANNKVLYDYYDIECYDPNGNYFGDKLVNDNCDYDSDEDGLRDANWAIEWQDSHTEGVDWYSCSSAHSQPLNANRKAYAAWWLWARLAGWNECLEAPSDLTATLDSETQQITLSWVDNSGVISEDAFIIQRQVNGGAWDNNYDTVAADITTYVDESLSPGIYAYRIVAHLDDDGTGNPCDSQPSNIAEAVFDFIFSNGLYQYDGTSWAQLTTSDADNTGNTMVAYNNGLAVNFGSLGLWYYNGTSWSRISTNNPEWLTAYNGSLVGDFGATYGLYSYNGSAWSQISTADADNTGNTMVAYNNGLAVDFGSYGLWYYDGTTWDQISTSDAQWLAAYNGKLVADGGSE